MRQTVELLPKKRSWSKDYHDYVFRDGTLVGDFENMYRHAAGVPWKQDTRADRWYAEVGILMLKEHAPYASILEVGCGLGYIAAKLEPLTKNGRASIEAFDISPTAIRKAQRLHPGIGFYVDDITQLSFRPRRRYALVVVRDLFWYVFQDLETVLRNLNACVQPHGWLYIGQSFPAPDRPFVGQSALPSPEALLARLVHYQPVYTALLRNHHLVNDGPIVHFLGRKRA